MELGTLLFIVFLILKLTGVITWSWWWVTCPLWVGFVFSLVIWLIFSVLFGVVGLSSRKRTSLNTRRPQVRNARTRVRGRLR